MKKLEEIARLCLEHNLGVCPTARACNISTPTASVYVEKLKQWGRHAGRSCKWTRTPLRVEAACKQTLFLARVH